ncbi:hypothetical protein [Muribaculum sp.]|uniref:hypothetical protein n=1 Tax=Muribaculum sp. TaxID=1918611 RepID=UPI0023C635CD|nr:hypothetical protein [Muribaculum sp.]MDE5704508.1 hypothetical protein [Muribaculum sp.]
MAIYKVRIKTEGNTTTYTTNATTLATVTYRPALDKWDVSAPSIGILADTKEEADKMARESITSFLASVGLTPDFINE